VVSPSTSPLSNDHTHPVRQCRCHRENGPTDGKLNGSDIDTTALNCPDYRATNACHRCGDGTWTYTPTRQQRHRLFTYTFNDGELTSTPVTVTIR
jgi:hypothetical protein